MTFDPQTPARERTAFGNFELHRTHLKTKPLRIPYKNEADDRDPEVIAKERHSAAVKVCDVAGTAADSRPLLEMLGLLEEVDG